MTIAAASSKILATVENDFPILRTKVGGKRLVYLDSAATSQKPQRVLDAMNEYWTESNANVHRGVHYLSQKATDSFEQARESVRRFVNAREAAEIVFTKGCTEGINLVASGLERLSGDTGDQLPRVGKGDVILLSEMEHHSNIVPWQMMAERTGAIVKPIPITDDCEIDLDAYGRLLRENAVKVLGIVHVSNAVGTVNPVAEMIKMAHEAGAIAVVDGAQAGPHILVDVQALDADFFTLSCHKMYAPTGIGVLYGKRHFLEEMPPYQGGGSMIRTVSFAGTTYAGIPEKFEPGTPNIAGVVGLGAAVEYLEELGSPDSGRSGLRATMAAIHEHEATLATYAEGLLHEIPGVRVIGRPREKAGIVSFVIDGVHPHDVGTILDSEGIAVRAGHHCCMPLMKRLGLPATARAAFALYNSRADAEALAMGVKKAVETFA